MRVIISNYPIPDSFVDNVTDTLRRLGHDVVTPKQIVGHSSHAGVNVARDLLERAFPDRWTASERWAVAAAKGSGGADLLLWLTKSLRAEVLKEVRRQGVRHLVAWWGDTPANMRGLGLLEDGWDAVFIKDRAAVRKFQALGINAHHLHEACNPAWHKRLWTEIGDDIVVAGSYYGYRQALVSRLLSAGEPLALYGATPPRWAGQEIKSAHRGRFIVREEKSRIFGEGLACLNSTALSEGDSLNCRAFEIAGACGLQLIEDKPAVSDCFEPDREVLTYSSLDQLRDHLARARREPSWAQSVREAGHARALAEHTYQHRLAVIMGRVGLPL